MAKPERLKREIKRKQKAGLKKAKIATAVARLFLLLLFFLIFINVIVPDRQMSGGENRMLTARPILTNNSVITGTFMSQYERYLSDQFVLRGLFRNLTINARRLGGNRVEDGVFLGRDNQLLEDIVTGNPDDLWRNIEGIQSFVRRYPIVNHHMMIVPDGANIWSDKLPPLATVADQNRQISLVRGELENELIWIDVSGALRDSNEKIYYQTDRYWTSMGAFIAFQDAASLLGIEGDLAMEFAAFPVTTDFRGGLATRSGFLPNTREEIFVYVPRGEGADVIVNHIDGQRRTTSVFEKSMLETRNQHNVFLGGDTSLIIIQTASVSNRRLLVIKDTFGNNFIQFLTPYFREIIVVDPRYYTGTIDEIMTHHRVTDSLILYSGNGFFGDNHLYGVIRREVE
jgi:hypothetical protein